MVKWYRSVWRLGSSNCNATFANSMLKMSAVEEMVKFEDEGEGGEDLMTQSHVALDSDGESWYV